MASITEAEHRRGGTDLYVVECPIGLLVGGGEHMCVYVDVHTHTYMCMCIGMCACVCLFVTTGYRRLRQEDGSFCPSLGKGSWKRILKDREALATMADKEV